MNGTTEINNKLYLLKANGMHNSDNRTLPEPRVSSDAHLQLQQVAFSVKTKTEERDQVSISEQAKERMLVEDAIKLETPPHITTVKEHVQELVRRTLSPGYENPKDAAELANREANEADDVLPVQASEEHIHVPGAKTPEAEALPVQKSAAKDESEFLPGSQASASQTRPGLIGAAQEVSASQAQKTAHDLVV